MTLEHQLFGAMAAMDNKTKNNCMGAILIDSEPYKLNDHRIHAKRTVCHRFMVIELDGSEDGRLVATFERAVDLIEVVKATGWNVAENLCRELVSI